MKRYVLLLSIVAAVLMISCGTTSSSSTDGDDHGNSVSDNDTANTGNSAEDGDSANTGDTADSGEDSDSADSGNTGDSAEDEDSTDTGNSADDDTADSGNSAPDEDFPVSDGIITKIRKGDYSEGDTVSFDAVVVGIVYNLTPDTHEPKDIKGMYVSELLKKAQPWTGIFIYLKSVSLNSYHEGDRIHVKGTYSIYFDQDQVSDATITKNGTFPVPEPAVITDPSTVATPFVSDGSGGWTPGTSHGADADSYQSVFIAVHDVAITKSDLGHGAWEITGNLAVDKQMYYYPGDRSVGVTFDTIQGILIYSYDAHRLAPRKEHDLVLEGAADTGNSGDSGDSADSADSGNSGDSGDSGNTAGGLSVRIVAGNISTGNAQSYDPGEGIRIFKALKGDIMLVQEFNYKGNTPSDYQEMANASCPVSRCYYSVPHPSMQIPNGIISRWPITEEGSWDDPNISNRELDWAVIDIPGSRDIFAISVHLHTKPAGDQVEAAQVIAKEVHSLMQAHPGKYYFVVGGDFNGPTAVSNNGFGQWNGSDVFYVSGPHPVGEDGSKNTNASRSKQYDFVLPDHALHAYQQSVVYHSVTDSDTKTYSNGLVFDTRDFSQSELDEFFPGTYTSDSGASNMQHMAIVKDFKLP